MAHPVSIAALSEPAALFLTAHGWLSTVPPELRDAILKSCRLREVSAGETFNFAGDTDAGIWGVVSGQVAITSGMNNADAPLGLLRHPGYWGGIAPLFGEPRLANVSARLPSVILFVPYQALRQMLDTNPSWWEHFGTLAHMHVKNHGQLAGDLMLPDTRARMAAILLHQAGVRNEGESAVTLVVTQEELGHISNMSRQPSGRLLRDFDAEGLIGIGYRRITVLQPEALRRVASGE